MAEQKKRTSSQSKQPATPPQPKRLYRSRSDNMLGGVCAGLAAYWGIDVTFIRIVWVAAVLLGGVGLFTYVLCWILIPEDPATETSVTSGTVKPANTSLVWGCILVCVGLVFLTRPFGISPWHASWRWHPGWAWSGGFDLLLPIAIIGIGILYLMNVSKKDKSTDLSKPEKAGGETMEKRLTRSVDERMIAGVCGGLAAYFGIDPSIVRIFFAILTLASGGFPGIIIYVVMLVVIPEESVSKPAGSGTKKTESKPKASAT